MDAAVQLPVQHRCEGLPAPCDQARQAHAEERALVTKAMQGGANSEKVATMKSGRGEIIVYRGTLPGSRTGDKGFQGIKTVA